MIIVYTKTGCPWAIEVCDYLKSKDIPFEERDMYTNPAFKDECEAKSSQSKSPTLDVDGDILPDCDAKQVEEFLKNKSI